MPGQHDAPPEVLYEQPVNPPRVIWLPTNEEARGLFEVYARAVNYLHGVVHIPTGRAQLESLYDSLDNGGTARLGETALILSMVSQGARLPQKCV